MATKEIITLQLGHYSNFIGTHWWNIQESSFNYNEVGDVDEDGVDHDVLYREGQTRRGDVTFTPRLVLADLKGGLGSLKSSSVLYEEYDAYPDAICWDGEMTIHRQEPEHRSQYLLDLDDEENEKPSKVQDVESNGSRPSSSEKAQKQYCFENDVKVWSDYLRTYLHPKSTVIINEYNHISESNPFDLWSKGANLPHACEELEERIRFYAEECDLMQGFHVLSDMSNGFGGLTSTMMRYLHDEFSSKQTVVFPLYPAIFTNDSKTKKHKRNFTTSITLSNLLELSSLVCPLSLSSDLNSGSIRDFPHLIYDASMSYHTSAVLAGALDTVTMKHRLKNNAINLQQFCANVTSMAKNLVSASLCLPLPLDRSEMPSVRHPSFFNLPEFLMGHLDKDPWTYLTPGTERLGHSVVNDFYAQGVTLRGVPYDKLYLANDHDFPFSQCSNATEMLNLYLNKRFYGCFNSAFALKQPLLTQVPFPQIFDETVSENGFLKSPPRNPLNPMKWIPQSLSDRSPNATPQNGQTNGVATNGQGENGHSDCSSNGHTSCNGSISSKSNGKVANMSNGLDVRCRKSTRISTQHVDSVPVMTNIQCSSKSVGLLSSAVQCLRESRRMPFHGMEAENLEAELEHLYTLQDEYKSSYRQASSDSDEDF